MGVSAGRVGGGTARATDGGGVNTRVGVDGGADNGGGAAAPREGAVGGGGGTLAEGSVTVGGGATVRDAVLGGVTDPAIPDAGVPGSGAPDVAAVPRAAGMDEDGRGGVDDAARGVAGFFGADGASIAITSVSPTNPTISAAIPASSSAFSDMPRRPEGRE